MTRGAGDISRYFLREILEVDLVVLLYKARRVHLHEPADPVLLERARAGDRAAFGSIADSQRVRIFRHCYRMLGSGPEAEDAVQDTLLKAWTRLDTYDERGSFDGWLYRIATNLCIDKLRTSSPRTHPVSLGPAATPGDPFADPPAGVLWVEPVADDQTGIGKSPETSALERERVSLAFVAALQRLSPRERAALLLHDVLDFSHHEVADVIEASPSAVNSLLYRARQSVGTDIRVPAADPTDPAVQALLARYLEAWELGDISRFVATVTDDVHFSMPPLPTWFSGRTDVAVFVDQVLFQPAAPGGIAVRLGSANGQPAVATYHPDDAGQLVVGGMQILDIDGSTLRIAAITSFRDPEAAIRCGFSAGMTK